MAAPADWKKSLASLAHFIGTSAQSEYVANLQVAPAPRSISDTEVDFIPAAAVGAFKTLCRQVREEMTAAGLVPPPQQSSDPRHIAFLEVLRLEVQDSPQWFPPQITMLHRTPDEYGEIFGKAISRTGKPVNVKRKRGRPSDTDSKADEQIAHAWRTGEHPTYQALAREKGSKPDGQPYTAHDIKLALDRHRQREKRKLHSSVG